MEIGFIGAGNIASAHMENVDSIDGAEITAVCDIDADRAIDRAGTYDATSYTDYETMYAEEALDAVYVAVPPFAHGEQEIAAATRGIDLFVEKPVALTAETAREVQRAIDRNDIIAQAGYQRRYDDLTDRALELVDDRPLALIELNRYCGVPAASWWRQKEKSGGQVVEMATHEYDFAKYVAGAVESVVAQGGQEVRTEEIDFEDTTTSALKHESGAVSHVTATSASPDWQNVAKIVGEALRLQIEGQTIKGVVDGEGISERIECDPQLEADRAFLTAVRENAPDAVRASYSEAVETLEVTLAVNEAIEAGESVRLG